MLPYIIAGISVALCGLILYKAQHIRILRETDNKKYLQEKEQILKYIQSSKDTITQYAKSIAVAKATEEQYEKFLADKKAELNIAQSKKDSLEAELESLNYSISETRNRIEQLSVQGQEQRRRIKAECEQYTEQCNNEIARLEDNIAELKRTINAGAEALLREQEKKQHEQFYRINLSENDIEDIAKLNIVKKQLHQPQILAKLIWTQYYQKPTTDMCNRVIGNAQSNMGIYKITSRFTGYSYIGQSVDISTRWKQHIKCGLGIDTPATNKFYKALMAEGVHHFTFEILENCQRAELDKCQRKWISMYETDKFGYNSTSGNKGK